MKITPTKDIIEAWIEQYVPNKDLFFISQEPSALSIDLKDVLVIPKQEFSDHTVYKQLHYLNSYELWKIKNVLYVLVAEKHWIEKLSKDEKQLLLNEQVKCQRGLVFPLTLMEHIEDIPLDYVVEGHLVIQRAMWEQWDQRCKEQFLITIVNDWWEEGECEQLPPFAEDFLVPFANKFCTIQGANCLASVLYAISHGTQEWFIYEWVHQNTFLQKLQQYHYIEIQDGHLQPKDIVVWKDTNGVIQHAAYHIADNYFFNKHGQTIFNPWKILLKDHLYKEWEPLTPVIYRVKR